MDKWSAITRISTSVARGKFALVVDSVRTADERIVLTQHGRDVAALIPVEDLALLEELEDRADIAEIRRRVKASSGTVTLKQLQRELKS
jgi:prevent-host-death family protein